MRILVGSDYHGKTFLIEEALRQIPEVDLYINCGDFCSWAGAQPEAELQGFHPEAAEEVAQLQEFLTAVDGLGKPWIFLPGNHDPSASVLEAIGRSLHHGQIITTPSLVHLGNVQTLAVPWTPPCGWNWTLTKTKLKELIDAYATTPVDLLITHAPPLGALDEESKWYHRRTPTLRPLVDQIQPRYYLCGHMHLDGGKTLTQGATTFVNAALHNLMLTI